MTERGRAHLQRSADEYVLGPSRLAWDDGALHIDVDERATPLPRAVRGRIVVRPQGLSQLTVALDAAGRHRWGPIAPCARIEVDLPAPGVRWEGHAYLDSNEGDEPIEQGFVRWDWLRATLPDGRCAVVYDAQPRQGEPRPFAIVLGADGAVEPRALGAPQALPRTALWRVDRRLALPAAPDGPRTGAVPTEPARVLRTLEDTPFYARSLLRLPWGDGVVDAVHETLDVTRLTRTVVQGMLPFRMPRVA